jgi:hypothetical protein
MIDAGAHVNAKRVVCESHFPRLTHEYKVIVARLFIVTWWRTFDTFVVFQKDPPHVANTRRTGPR